MWFEVRRKRGSLCNGYPGRAGNGCGKGKAPPQGVSGVDSGESAVLDGICPTFVVKCGAFSVKLAQFDGKCADFSLDELKFALGKTGFLPGREAGAAAYNGAERLCIAYVIRIKGNLNAATRPR